MSNEIADERALDPASTLPDLRTIVEAAFEKAKASGKETWNVMTVAVLKNRLLDETTRDFSERQYGASSMSDLVQQLPDVLELDDSVTPAIVRLRGDLSTAQKTLYHGLQIRKDLWDSVVNYSLGEPYLWSGSVALPRSSYEGFVDLPVLPTLSLDEEKVWRSEFVDRVSSTLEDDERDLLRQWIDGHKSPKILPSSIQRQWYEDFKSRAINRLRSWFADQPIPEPADLIQPTRKMSRRTGTQLDELRSLVLRCVENMTEAELSELRLPPQALLRGERR